MSLIQQLKEGKVVIKINPGVSSVDDLNRVLLATGKESNVNGFYEYYWIEPGNNDIQRHDDRCPHPCYPLDDFIAELNKNQNTQPMSNKTISSKQAQQIIDIACPTWKAKLAPKWSLDIVLSKSIEIPDSEYRGMRAACTTEQHVLFDKIFGNQYEIGTHVIVKGYHKNYDGRVLKITRIDDNRYVYFEVLDGGKSNKTDNFDINRIVRLATPEEIQQATQAALFPPKGTWCLVKDNSDESWYVRMYNGDGKFVVNEHHCPNSWGLFMPIEQSMLEQMKILSPDMFQ
jgi:hypothetical protein